MLELFTESARHVVRTADVEAHHLEHDRVGTEHLLLALAADRDGRVGAALRQAGVDLDAARLKVIEAVPPTGASPSGDLPRTARAQRALDRAVRFARRDRRSVEPEHLLLGVLDVEGVACQVLRGLGIDVGRLRDELVARDSEAAAPAAVGEPAAPAGLRCPACGDAIEPPLPGRAVEVRLDDATERSAVAVSCPSCGALLGLTLY